MNKNIKNKLKLTAITTPLLTMFCNLKTYATTIGTQEVETATQNIRDAVVELAMPIRECSYVCKYCYYCNQDNSKCK